MVSSVRANSVHNFLVAFLYKDVESENGQSFASCLERTHD